MCVLRGCACGAEQGKGKHKDTFLPCELHALTRMPRRVLLQPRTEGAWGGSKTGSGSHYVSAGRAKKQNTLTIESAGQDDWKAQWKCTMRQPHWKAGCRFLLKLNIHLPPSQKPMHLPKRNENIRLHKILDPNVYSSFIYRSINCPKLETTQMSLNRR